VCGYERDSQNFIMPSRLKKNVRKIAVVHFCSNLSHKVGDRSNDHTMTEKTPEELEAERKEALEQINQILDTTRPKNLQQGVSSGLSNIVSGAVGAVGVAILLPTVGMAVGAKKGGLFGMIFGLTGGAVVGALGAAALAIGGK